MTWAGLAKVSVEAALRNVVDPRRKVRVDECRDGAQVGGGWRGSARSSWPFDRRAIVVHGPPNLLRGRDGVYSRPADVVERSTAA